MEKIKENFSSFLEQFITLVELAIALLLVLLAILSFGYLGILLISLFQTHIFLRPQEVHSLLDSALILFLIIELFRIALAYARGGNILGTVIEAAFVAIARKIVLYDYGEYSGINGLLVAIALAVLLSALALTYLAIYARSRKEP